MQRYERGTCGSAELLRLTPIARAALVSPNPSSFARVRPPPPPPPAAYVLGAPPIAASGSRSMEYLCSLMYMMGTPGTFLILLLRSRSQVATM